MTTSESKGQFFYKTNRFESIRITNRIESIRIANWNALVSMLFMGVARSKYVGWTDIASAERMEPTGESSPNLNRTDPLSAPPPCRNSSDLYQFQERPVAKVGWTCPPQSAPWRRHWCCLLLVSLHWFNAYNWTNDEWQSNVNVRPKPTVSQLIERTEQMTKM